MSDEGVRGDDRRSDSPTRADRNGRPAGGVPAQGLTASEGDVLVLRALGLGDALTGVPALRGIRRAFPGRRLVLAGPAEPGAWFRELGIIDEVLPTSGLDAPLRWERPGGHIAVNLHGRGPQSHRLLCATEPESLIAFACSEVGHPGPRWFADEHEVERWCRLVRSAGGECSAEDLRLPVPRGAEPRGRLGTEAHGPLGTEPHGPLGTEPHGPLGTEAHGPLDERHPTAPQPSVVVHPGAASMARRWPAERWSAVCRALARMGHPVVLTGSGDEVAACEQIALAAGTGVRSAAGSLTLHDLAETVGSAALLLCGDTGVAHLATALGTPSVLLFGPTPPMWWGPAIDEHLHAVIWHGNGPGDPHADAVDAALAAIGVDEVVEAARGLLERATARTGALR